MRGYIPGGRFDADYETDAIQDGIDPQRVLALKADYEEKFMEAAQEDREAVAIRFVPRSLFYSR